MNENPHVPGTILPDEKLVRFIFSPFHLNKSMTRLLPNAFRPPYERDEVSVTRLKLTDAHFCKKQGMSMDAGDGSKSFCGLAVVNYPEVLSVKAGARASALSDNPFHADIYYGVVTKKGEPLPAELNERMKALAELARFYLDKNKDAALWEGENLE